MRCKQSSNGLVHCHETALFAWSVFSVMGSHRLFASFDEVHQTEQRSVWAALFMNREEEWLDKRNRIWPYTTQQTLVVPAKVGREFP